MIKTEPELSQPTAAARNRLPHVIGVVCGIGLLAGGVLFWTGRFPEPSAADRAAHASTSNADGSGLLNVVPPDVGHPPASSSSSIVSLQPASPADAKKTAHARAILGAWKQYSHGHRLLEVMEDGTASIDVTLDGLSAIAFGEKLHFDIEWTIDGDELVFETTGGTPEASVNAVKGLYGDNRVYRILEINEKQMLLQEGDEQKTPWDRVIEE